MILGIGIDTVNILAFRKTAGKTDSVFTEHTFTEVERNYASAKADPLESLAGIFAAKEAVAKALNPSISEDAPAFDWRRLEILHHEDDSPYLAYNQPLSMLMEQAGIGSILISISHDVDYASAIALSQSIN